MAILLSFASNLHAQTEDPPIDSIGTDTMEMVYLDSVVLQSPNRITMEAACAVRYALNADVYLRWDAVPGVMSYTVLYQFNGMEAVWLTAQANTNALLLEGVPLDTTIICQVVPLGIGLEDEWESDVINVSTAAQREPVVVSHGFYNRLEAWFAKEENEEGFCQFLTDVEGVDQYEILSFLQAYAFDNAVFQKPANSSTSSFQAYFPPDAVFGAGPEQWCVPVVSGSCRCKVISRGSNLATPNFKMASYQVLPKKYAKIIGVLPDGTGEFEYRSEAGAAKFATLKQDRTSGGSALVRSNLPLSGDPQSVTTETSELVFFLACINNSGIFNTNLPVECDCARPLHVYYEYTTKLRIMSKTRGCIWSKGSEATAEDWAFIGVYRGKTGDITPVDAGRATLNSSCKSNWNPDFWIKLLDVLNPVAQHYVQTLDSTSGNKIPTTNQISQFISGLQTLIKTPFKITDNGGCKDEERDAVLVTGSKTYMLGPNEPIRVSLFSSYYIRTRGYGCWRSEAGVASDYYLLGVVESEADPVNPECCANKYGNYILGSQSAPYSNTITFGINAVNSGANRADRVGFLLSQFGGWYNLGTIAGSGIVIVPYQYYNELSGPSCIYSDNDQRPATGIQANSVSSDAALKFAVFPSLTSDLLNIQVSAGARSEMHVNLYDAQGRLAKVAYSGEIEVGSHLLHLPVGELPKGVYLVQCETGTTRQNFKIVIL